jgi:hypothetical protein
MPMTEMEWSGCADPRPMLAFLRGRASERDLRLFACACTRRVWGPTWSLGRNEPDRATVEEVERLAEGSADSAGLATVRGRASLEVELLACEEGFGAAWWATEELPMAMPRWQDEMAPQADLLRDIFGNPFRPALPLSPDVLAWNGGTVSCLAESIYEKRWMLEGTLDSARLALLADALLDAGCENEQLLAHLRTQRPHVRGCWVLDLILGKE